MRYLFTDIGMPEMNGWELAEGIRKKYGSKIIIVAVNGWNIEEKVNEKQAIDFFIQKPFSMADIKKIFTLVVADRFIVNLRSGSVSSIEVESEK